VGRDEAASFSCCACGGLEDSGDALNPSVWFPCFGGGRVAVCDGVLRTSIGVRIQ
jgi:hypothetical protein